MNRFLLNLMVISLSLLFTGCGGGSSTGNIESNTTKNQTAKPDETKTKSDVKSKTLSAEEIAQEVEKAYGANKKGLAGEEGLVHMLTHVSLKRGECKTPPDDTEASEKYFGGEYQAFWDGDKMVKDQVKIEYFAEPGKRGMIKANTGIPNHWDYFCMKYPDTGDNIFTYLVFGSDGLYDVNLWNNYLSVYDWVNYNAMIQFFPYSFTTPGNGYEYHNSFLISAVYTQDWDGTNTDRDVFTLKAALWIAGENEVTNIMDAGDFYIHKKFLKEYKLLDGRLLDNCLVGEFRNGTEGLREDWEYGPIKTTVVIHLGGDHGLNGDFLKYFKKTNQNGHGVIYMKFEKTDKINP